MPKKKPKKPKKTRKVVRSARTGKFVETEKADTSPATTVEETVPVGKREQHEGEVYINEDE